MAKTRPLGANRMLVEPIENRIEAEKQKQQEFFDLAERFRSAVDPEEVKRLGDRMGRWSSAADTTDIIVFVAKEYVEERNGGLYVAGTRVSLDSIVQCFNDGMSPETILGEFDTLTLAQVYGAIAHYLDDQPAVDAYRLRQKQRFEQMRRAAEPLPADLRQRLDAAREQLRSGR